MLPGSERTAGAHLARDIRQWDLVALVLNSVVGAGIFGLPSQAYALAGAYSLLAYLVCAVPIILIILCFAEVSSRFKDTGGPYLYARATLGPFVGFEIGWLSWVVRLAAFAALCNLFVDYLSVFLPASGSGPGRVLAISMVVSLLTAANLAGVRLASVVGNAFTIGKLVPLVLLAVVGLFFVDPQSYSSAIVPRYTAFSASVLLLVFAFTGFENCVIPAGEALDPRRHLPFALMAGIAMTVVLYVLIQAVCIGTLPELATSPRPLADVGQRLFGSSGSAIIALGALVSVTGTMNAIMLVTPRVLFAMAEHGQLPAMVAATNKRFHTPHVAILFSAVGMLVLTLTGTFRSAATLSVIIRLTTYAVTCATVLVLRRRTSPPEPTFTAPAGQHLAIAALALIAWLFSSSSWPELRRAAGAGAVGLVLYAAFAARRSEVPNESDLTSAGRL